MSSSKSKVLVAGEGAAVRELAALFEAGGWEAAWYALESPERALDRSDTARDEVAEALAEGARGASVVLETLAWPFERKRALVEALDRAVPAGVPLVTWCAAQSTTEIASWTAHPRRVVGYSLLPPLDAGGLVEIAPGLDSDAAAIDAVAALFEAAGREVARVRDDAGLVQARIVCLIVNEAAAMLQEGVASARDIDTAMKLGANYPRGPLEWADLIGLDTVYAVLSGVLQEQAEDRYRPCPLLRKMVLAGRLGRKTGCGFFEYPAS